MLKIGSATLELKKDCSFGLVRFSRTEAIYCSSPVQLSTDCTLLHRLVRRPAYVGKDVFLLAESGKSRDCRKTPFGELATDLLQL